MNEQQVMQTMRDIRQFSTEELMRLTQERSETRAIHAEAARQLLAVREVQNLPNRDDVRAGSGVAYKSFGHGSNVTCRTLENSRIEMKFATDGTIAAHENAVFRDDDHLLSFVAEAFSLSARKDLANISMKRTGRYRRVNGRGEPVFTFGDPVLDLITDEHGWLKVGKETTNLRRIALADQKYYKGGISNIDISRTAAYEKDQMLTDASSNNARWSVVRNESDVAVFASKNPSTVVFLHGNGKMRFHSWKYSAFFYASLGTEIETWNGDFQAARIDSVYGSTFNSSSICFVTKKDADHDMNDDYVDEYEWSAGFAVSPPADGVRSHCVANWRDAVWPGDVTTGSCGVIIG